MRFETTPNGVLLIDKSKGFTSHDVVNVLRRVLGTRRVGHAGTLDPDATGLLMVCVGRATKWTAALSQVDKSYRMKFRLGVETDTYDSSGKVVAERPAHVTEEMFLSVLSEFTGEIDQKVPLFSAVKVKGRKLYEYARKGIEVEAPVRKITVHEAKLLMFRAPEGELDLAVSKGTYVRGLIHDIGQKLGCGAVATDIRRTRCGEASVEDAWPLERAMNEAGARETLLSRMLPFEPGGPDFKKPCATSISL